LVIHADLPSNSETLLHRSGRTGRAGSKGVSALIVAPSEFKKAQRLLQGAKVVAEWGTAPSADEITARDDLRLFENPILAQDLTDEMDTATALIARFGAEQIAAAFVRGWRSSRSAPEVLSDQAGPPRDAAPPRERNEFGASVWFALSVGRAGRAEARWLLPKICDAGGITKDGIGAIRVQEDRTFVQIAEGLASKFGATLELENGVMMERMAGEPDLDRPERAPRKTPERAPRKVAERAPAERAPVRERAEKPAYVPKASRIVDEDTPRYNPLQSSDVAPVEAPKPPRTAPPKPYAKREEGDAKPYAPRAAKPYVKREDGDRKPYAPRAEGAKPYAKREDGDRKPYAPRAEGAKPYAKREDGDRKPYAPRADGAKPYAKREDGDRKPYAPRGDAEAKPRWKSDAPAKPRSAGFKSQDGEGKPARAAGFKSHGSEGKTFGKPARPAGPRADAKDTSKRFVPPKKPKT